MFSLETLVNFIYYYGFDERKKPKGNLPYLLRNGLQTRVYILDSIGSIATSFHWATSWNTIPNQEPKEVAEIEEMGEAGIGEDRETMIVTTLTTVRVREILEIRQVGEIGEIRGG